MTMSGSDYMNTQSYSNNSDYPPMGESSRPPTNGMPPRSRRFRNGWPTLPLRIFLAWVFLFGGYAKLTYPGFFDPKASFGFKSAVDSAKVNSPIKGLMGPLSDHACLFGHITAFAELAIGLGLLVGLFARVAALGGMVLAVMIVLSINWNEVRQYTGNGGAFTSVDLAITAAMSVFVLGGAGPLSLDGAYTALRDRRRARDTQRDLAEPRYNDSEADLAASRQRLRGAEPTEPALAPPTASSGPTAEPPATEEFSFDPATFGTPEFGRDTKDVPAGGDGGRPFGTDATVAPPRHPHKDAEQDGAEQDSAKAVEQRTEQLPPVPVSPVQKTEQLPQIAPYGQLTETDQHADHLPDPEPDSPWTPSTSQTPKD